MRRDGLKSGRPSGAARLYENHHKPLGAPVLRRDPTGHEKLRIVRAWREKVVEHGVSKVSELPTRVKQGLENAWRFGIDTIKRWVEIEASLKEHVAKFRLGEHGLRVFGSREATSKKESLGRGCTLRVANPGVPTPQQPLERVYSRLKAWMDLEREFNSEVRGRSLNTRVLYELEYERDRELVLEQNNDPEYKPYVLEAAREKISYMQVSSISKRQRNWFERTLLRKIGASAASGQRLVSSSDRDVDEKKARLTWATSDRFIHLVARGTPSELEPYVSDVEECNTKQVSRAPARSYIIYVSCSSLRGIKGSGE